MRTEPSLTDVSIWSNQQFLLICPFLLSVCTCVTLLIDPNISVYLCLCSCACLSILLSIWLCIHAYLAGTKVWIVYRYEQSWEQVRYGFQKLVEHERWHTKNISRKVSLEKKNWNYETTWECLMRGRKYHHKKYNGKRKRGRLRMKKIDILPRKYNESHSLGSR